MFQPDGEGRYLLGLSTMRNYDGMRLGDHMQCSNCEQEHKTGIGMTLMYNDTIIATLCPACLTDVNVGKLVFKKNGDTYEYEAYLPVECR